eukprot:2309716-Amphidinium_carterae.1
MSHSKQNPTTPKPHQPSLGLGEIKVALVGKSSVPKPPPAKSSGYEPNRADGARPIVDSAQEAQTKPPPTQKNRFPALTATRAKATAPMEVDLTPTQ